MKIGFVLRSHAPGALFLEVTSNLEGRGVATEFLLPEQNAVSIADLRPDCDLYVLKPGSGAALALGAVLEAAGAAVINPYPVSALCRDRSAVTAVLTRSGIPTPQTYVAATASHLAPFLDEGPLIVKPNRGSRGRGIEVAHTPEDLASEVDDGEPVVAQRYHEGDGRDRKLYMIDGTVIGVARPWPVRSPQDKTGTPFAPDAELIQIVDRVGEALGIDVFGVDVVMTEEGPLVVDVSAFPGFHGAVGAADLLARYLYGAVARAIEGVPPIRRRLTLEIPEAARL